MPMWISGTAGTVKHVLPQAALEVLIAGFCYLWTEPGRLFPPVASLCAKLCKLAAGSSFIFTILWEWPPGSPISSLENLEHYIYIYIYINMCLRVCVHPCIQYIWLCVSTENVIVAWWRRIAPVSGDQVLGILCLNRDVLFARGKSDKHVQHCGEERSGANFEEHVISISPIYMSFSWHSDRATSVQWADEN